MTPDQRNETLAVIAHAMSLGASFSVNIHPDTPSDEAALNRIVQSWGLDKISGERWTSRSVDNQRVTVTVHKAPEPDRPAGPPNGTTVKGAPRSWGVTS